MSPYYSKDALKALLYSRTYLKFKGTPPPIKVKYKLLIGPSINFTQSRNGQCDFPFWSPSLYLNHGDRERGIGYTAEVKKRPWLKILLLLQILQPILQISHKHSQLKYKGRLEAGFLIFALNHPKKTQNFLKIFKVRFFHEISTFGCTKKNLEAN